MRYPYAFLMGGIAFLLQSTMLSHLSIFGTTPNLVLCSVILLSFLYEGTYGMAVGVVFGLIQDISFSLIIGPAAFCNFVVAILIGEVRHFLYRDSVFNLSLAALIGTITYYGLNWLILALFGGIYGIAVLLLKVPILFATQLVVLLVYYLSIGRRSIRHPEDRYYRGNRIYFQ